MRISDWSSDVCSSDLDMGLDLPAHERFVKFLGNAVTGNFGLSYYHRQPVMDVIASRLPATIELSLVALIFALAVSIPLGVAAAVKKNTWLDRLATVSQLGSASCGERVWPYV